MTLDLCKMLQIKYPIIQAGMVWVSGANLAAASANAGVLGVIGAGSMTCELLDQQIKKTQSLTTKSLAVNLPLLYKDIENQIEICLKNKIQIFITSAGSPKLYTTYLKSKGVIVIHVTSHPELAKKCEEAGCDAVIAEGFEAGGHNGKDELTTMTLIPQVVEAVKIPVIAAGGIATGKQMAAAMCLGAKGVQIGSRFVASFESSAHENFKNYIVDPATNHTFLMMKKHIPVRLLKNDFFEQVRVLEEQGASKSELIELLGKGRAKLGMHLGDLKNGELEIGQVVGMIKKISSAKEIINEIIKEYNQVKLHPL